MTDPNSSPLPLKEGQNGTTSPDDQNSLKKLKIDKIKTFTLQTYKKIHNALFIFLILCIICYSFPMMYLNYLNVLNNQPSNCLVRIPQNQFSLWLWQFSNYSIIYHSQTNIYIQDFILMGLLLLLLILMVIIEGWLRFSRNKYEKQLSRIQSYSLQITVKNKVRKKEIKQINQYFQLFTSKCLNQKIAQLTQDQQKSKTDQRATQIKFLTQVSHKISLIQDIILVPYRTKQVSEDSIDIREQEANILVVNFAYEQLATIVLQWCERQENLQSIKTYIVNIQKAHSPKSYLFDKLKNKQDYKNKVQKNSKFILIAIIWEFAYIILISGFIYLQTVPQFIFTPQVKYNYSLYINYGLLVIQAFTMFMHTKLFQQRFIVNQLVKSNPAILTFQKQAFKTINLHIFFYILNVVVVPLVAFLGVVFYDQNLDFGNIKYICQVSLFSQFGMVNLLVYYAVLKYIVIATFSCFIQFIHYRIRRHRFVQQSQTQKDLTAYCMFIIESFILISWSVLLSPVIACALFFGVLFKLGQFCSIEQIENICFISITHLLQKCVKTVKFIFIILTCIIANSCLNGYMMVVDESQQMYPTIITLGGSFFTLIMAIIFEKCGCSLSSNCCMFSNFPEQVIDKNKQNPSQNQTKNISNQKQLAQIMSKNIFIKQKFLYIYYDQIKQGPLYFNTIDTFQLNKKQQTQKVVQELNTMSRSLQQSLKQRLLTATTNPFQISPSKQEEAQYDDMDFEDKVRMNPTKRKKKFVPQLFIPQRYLFRPAPTKPLAQYERKATVQQQKKGKPKRKRTYNDYNMANNDTNSWNQVNIGDSDFEREIMGKNQPIIDNKIDNRGNKAPRRTKNKQQLANQIAKQLLKRKIKFTDLFDSQEQSIKNLVKKKIKQSIPKIQH